MLGRFLEVSVRAGDVQASVEFYESLGFVQATVGDALEHPYAVVTDGRLFVGLHQWDLPSPILTWVRPEVARHAGQFAALGIEPAFARLDEVALNELAFADPSGQLLMLIEARTFSPPPYAPRPDTACGYFEEFGIPTPDLARSARFWDHLGLVAFDAVEDPFRKVVVASTDLNVGLYDLDLPVPALTFSDPEMPARIQALRDRGHRFANRLPRGLDPARSAMLLAPEGTTLLLTTSVE
jgi:catechol 2,3-dioxygenase-like lactoylglutathione lyase family enzyme